MERTHTLRLFSIALALSLSQFSFAEERCESWLVKQNFIEDLTDTIASDTGESHEKIEAILHSHFNELARYFGRTTAEIYENASISLPTLFLTDAAYYRYTISYENVTMNAFILIKYQPPINYDLDSLNPRESYKKREISKRNTNELLDFISEQTGVRNYDIRKSLLSGLIKKDILPLNSRSLAIADADIQAIQLGGKMKSYDFEGREHHRIRLKVKKWITTYYDIIELDLESPNSPKQFLSNL